jgi:glycosyltransferase involved in cell wall biosynthesis
MKICFITEKYNLNSGGQYTSLKQTSSFCKKKRIQYVIIHKESRIHNDKVLLKKVLSSCDIFHIFGGWSLFYIKFHLLALKLKKKIIIHPLGFYEPWSLNQKKLKKKIAWNLYQKKLLLSADIIHCASDNEQKNLLKLDKRFKTTVLPFGIEYSFVKKINRKKLKKKALFFSRLHKKKGLHDLIHVWQDIGNKDWTLDIVGDGKDRNFFNKIVLTKKSVNINLLNPVYGNKKKIKLFDKYDFFILPTKSENFGISIIESLARGLPVLTTINTPWESISKYNAGWIVSKVYPELKSTLIKIFNMSRDDFFIKSKNSIRLAKKFRWSIISNQYIKVYKSLLNPLDNHP